jgi:hypothetical protein
VRCGRDPVGAATYLKRAAALYHKLRLAEPLNECTQALAVCARLPFLAMHVLNPGNFVQGEACELELRLTNEGVSSTVGSVWLELGGGLKQFVTANIPELLPPGGSWRVPLTVTPVQLHSTLQIEIAYASGIAAQDTLRGLMVISVDAVKQDRPINIGDIARLELHIGGATKEGIQIRTQDVGGIFNRGGRIDAVNVTGDVGALVGVDPALRQQVADLRNSVGWLAERLARIETGAQGATPATGEELSALRQDLSAYRSIYETLQAFLAAEHRAAIADVAAELKQLGGKLDMLDRGQQAIREDLAAQREAILSGLAGTERRIVGAVLARLDAQALADVQAIKGTVEAGRLADLETQTALAELQTLIADIQRRQVSLPAAVAAELAQIQNLTTGTELDVKHKLVLELPIVPLLLSYQGEFELADGLKLAELWRRLVAKVRGIAG